jgi:purine-binding chemotaxis protein CheW
MDFLEIRKKAKERAEARAAEAARAAQAERAAPATDAVPGGETVVTDADVVEGALAARLQGLPAPEAAAPAADARFTTWRPGSGAPPVVATRGPGDPRAAPDQAFTVVDPAAVQPAPAARPPPAQQEPAPPGDPLDDFFYRADEAAPALPQIAAAGDAAEEEPALLVREEYLTFLLGPEEYAVAIERVREVIKAPPITEVPRAPAHILGVVTVRGEVVAVVDPRQRLGLARGGADGHGKVVIVDVGDGPCGLLVDRVASVVRLRPGSIEPCPQGIAAHRAEYLAGIGRAGGDRLFAVLDLGTLLRPPGGPPRGGGFAAASPSRRPDHGDGADRARRSDARA